jgi:hypothetical protein
MNDGRLSRFHNSIFGARDRRASDRGRRGAIGVYPCANHRRRGMPELRISSDKVCDFIEMAREVAGLVPPTTGDRTTTGDDSRLVTIEDQPGDSRWSQMREFILGLNGRRAD